MTESKSARRRRAGPNDLWALDQMRANRQPNVLDKEALRAAALALFTQSLDEKLAEMVPGEGLGVVFNIQVLRGNPRDQSGYALWRKAVLERDGHTRQECGNREQLEAHHIQEWARCPEKRLDVSNGLTLCSPCHAARHPHVPVMRGRKRQDGASD